MAVVAALAVVGYFLVGNIFSMESSSSAASQGGSLVMQDTVVGTGAEAKVGDVLTVNYTGKFDNGTVFDTSVGKQPFTFVLGAGQVIPGWDQGLMGMRVGGKRTLIVPPNLGYGSEDYGPIPGNSTLTFEVELLSTQENGSF